MSSQHLLIGPWGWDHLCQVSLSKSIFKKSHHVLVGPLGADAPLNAQKTSKDDGQSQRSRDRTMVHRQQTPPGGKAGDC